MPAPGSVGCLHGDVACLEVGSGPPLVLLPGLSPDNDVPGGWERRMLLGTARSFADDFSVHVLTGKRGLRPGESMSGIAGHLADAIERDLGGPVFLLGLSTGGSMALQLAVDRPDLVQRLVLVAAAYRLGPRGRELQAELARMIRAGRPREGWARLMTATLPRPLRGPARPLSWLVAGSMVSADPADLLVTLDAEDVFDARAGLRRVTAPTLVIGGSADVLYPEEFFRDTAAGVQDGRVHVFRGWGHVRTGSSSATTHLALGFLLAGLPVVAPG
ncbi:alpha/beta fold hydrolase [Blastococcus sp. TF02A-30]|uniref:alpha/beta fold hydrolase n=1 Tax=Blastococcus sp. TF02A-30 TaxID=2250580 RepID=UPI000DEB71CC|nr:alpha/beta hydrolase [Blastococcus sp. TF02A-30]RBY89438.1 alpha/beta hydrolase [Blastococcus sp. TF02A-30]